MKLRKYLDSEKISVADFAESIGVGQAAVYAWLAGKKYPSPPAMERIAQTTKNKVQPNDFYNFPLKPNGSTQNVCNQ